MTEQTQTPEVSLELTDIMNATQIMKAAIERGVFQADEMSGVAGVYDKFTAFVKQIQEQQSDAHEAAGIDSAETKPAE